MSDIIQLLPDSVANQIAAGEVIQRPSSAVKELLENAIDAGSTRIEVYVKDSGKTLLQVIDNGSGMSPTDARLSFERHATSKIRSAEDLFSIRTMGFRGEALASIASVAQVEVKTRRHEDELGTQIIIEGSDFKSQDPVSAPAGTSFSVKNLFYNIPARRNFLKSNPVEARHIIDEFERVALAHPSVAMSLNQNGLEVFNLPVSNLRQRIVNLYGSHYNERLVPVQEQTTLLNLHGFVGKPEFSRKTRGEQYFFVNNRYIKDGYLHHAVTNAFEELLPKDSYASYWIFIDIDPARIDVNIHPTKTEIKFEDERSVYAIIRASVKRSLGQYSVTPTLDFERETAFDIPHKDQFKPVPKPGVTVNTGYNPFRKDDGSSIRSSGWEKMYENIHAVDLQVDVPSPEQQVPIGFHHEEKTEKAIREEDCFQISNTTVVCRLEDRILLMDQQSAHERIIFERLLRKSKDGPVAIQNELFPTTFQFPPQDFIILSELQEELRFLGFDLREFGSNSFVLQGSPEVIEKGSEKEFLEQLIDHYKHSQSVEQGTLRQHVIKTIARSLAIRRGRKLSRSEMKHLATDLLSCQEPSLGIDGKPCSWMLTNEEILSRMRR